MYIKKKSGKSITLSLCFICRETLVVKSEDFIIQPEMLIHESIQVSIGSPGKHSLGGLGHTNCFNL